MEKYEKLEMEIIEFETEDVILTSNGQTTNPGDIISGMGNS